MKLTRTRHAISCSFLLSARSTPQREHPDASLAPIRINGPCGGMGPHCNWRTLTSSPSPSLPTLILPLPTTPPRLFFFDAAGGGGPNLVWGRGPRAQGTWGQTHNEGYSNAADLHCSEADQVHQNHAILCGCGGDFHRSPWNFVI